MSKSSTLSKWSFFCRSKAFLSKLSFFVDVKLFCRSKAFFVEVKLFCHSERLLKWGVLSSNLRVMIKYNEISIWTILLIKNIQRLAKEVLAEVPNQFELYMRRRGIKPIGWNLKEISRSELTPKNSSKVKINHLNKASLIFFCAVHSCNKTQLSEKLKNFDAFKDCDFAYEHRKICFISSNYWGYNVQGEGVYNLLTTRYREVFIRYGSKFPEK